MSASDVAKNAWSVVYTWCDEHRKASAVLGALLVGIAVGVWFAHK